MKIVGRLLQIIQNPVQEVIPFQMKVYADIGTVLSISIKGSICSGIGPPVAPDIIQRHIHMQSSGRSSGG